MNYEEPLFRPPNEADSLIFQTTLGCSNNTCAFCGMYKDRKFRIRPLENVLNEIEEMKSRGDNVTKVFLADGNALCLPVEYLLTIFVALKKTFPRCRRISLYGAPGDVLAKSEEELKILGEAGLSLVYMGFESGCAAVLKESGKKITPDLLIEAGQKLRRSLISLSVTLISGLGGKYRWKEHAVESARVVNAVQPEYVSLLTLMVVPGTQLYKRVLSNEFQPLNPEEVLGEIRLFVDELNLARSRFNCNHASNFVPVGGMLPAEKERILAILDQAIKGERWMKPEFMRGL